MAYRSSASASSAAGGTITATPPGVQAHDYLAGFYTADGSRTITQPTGWSTQINLDQVSPDGQSTRFSDKFDATGSDAFGWGTTDGVNVAVENAAWSGRDNTTPRSATPVSTINTTANASPISASLTGITAQNGDDIGVFMATDQDAAAARWTFSQITNYIERIDGIAVDWISGLALDTRDAVSAGATGALASTITRGAGTGNAGYSGIVIAIKAASAGSGFPPVPESLHTKSQMNALLVN
jgi:hypothetical protein